MPISSLSWMKTRLVLRMYGNFAAGIENVAEFPRAGGADLDAGGIPAGAGALDAEMAFFHHALAPRPVAKVGHVGVQPLLGNRGLGEVEAPRPVGTGCLAVAAADAPVVVDHRDAVGLLPGGMHRADLDAGRILALLALHRHVEVALFRHRLRSVVVLGVVDVKRAMRHLAARGCTGSRDCATGCSPRRRRGRICGSQCSG